MKKGHKGGDLIVHLKSYVDDLLAMDPGPQLRHFCLVELWDPIKLEMEELGEELKWKMREE